MAEASAKDVLGQISQGHLECPICCCLFNDPKILDCLHSFCLNCLDELVSKQQPKTDEITCPVCRKVTPVPSSGLSGLTNCFFLSSLVDEFNKQERLLRDETPSAPICQECDEGSEAVARCLDCKENICPKCQETHLLLKYTRSHKITPLGDVDKTEQVPPKKLSRKTGVPKCIKHPIKKVSFYCDTCKMLICVKCAAIDHRTVEHDCSEVDDAVRSYRQFIDEAFQKFEKNRTEFKTGNESLEHARNRLRMMVDRACRDISTKEEEEIAKIRNKSRLLKEKVTAIGQERDAGYKKVFEANRDKMAQAEQTMATVKDLMQQADDFELLDLKPKVLHNLEHQEELRFESERHELSFIGVKCHDVVRDTDLGDILCEEKWQLKSEFGKEGRGDGEFQIALHVGCFSSGDIIVADMCNERLSLFTASGQYKTKLNHLVDDGNSIEVGGVAVTSDDMLLVTHSSEVKVCDNSLKMIQQFTPFKIDRVVDFDSGSYLAGIAVDKKKRVAVADMNRNVITVHSIDGSLIASIPRDKIDLFLTIGNNDNVIITGTFSKTLICVDFNGKEIFNTSTCVNNKLATPWGVCCDDAGDIYVVVCCDVGSGEVHHYTPQGVHVGCVARGLFNPMGVTFSPDGDLVVADYHSIKIFHRV